VEHALRGEVLRATQAEFSVGAEEMRPLWEDATRMGQGCYSSGGARGGRPAPLAWRFLSVSTRLTLDAHAIGSNLPTDGRLADREWSPQARATTWW
jgi:hypothetical protein